MVDAGDGASDHAPDGVTGGDRVVGVHDVEREPLVEPAQRAAERPSGVAAPRAVAAPPGRAVEADVGDRDPVDLGLARLGAHLSQRPQEVPRAGGARRDRAVQDQHVDLGPGAAGGERLLVGPDPEHGVVGPGVELGDHADPQRGAGSGRRGRDGRRGLGARAGHVRSGYRYQRSRNDAPRAPA